MNTISMSTAITVSPTYSAVGVGVNSALQCGTVQSQSSLIDGESNEEWRSNNHVSQYEQNNNIPVLLKFAL